MQNGQVVMRDCDVTLRGTGTGGQAMLLRGGQLLEISDSRVRSEGDLLAWAVLTGVPLRARSTSFSAEAQRGDAIGLQVNSPAVVTVQGGEISGTKAAETDGATTTLVGTSVRGTLSTPVPGSFRCRAVYDATTLADVACP